MALFKYVYATAIWDHFFLIFSYRNISKMLLSIRAFCQLAHFFAAIHIESLIIFVVCSIDNIALLRWHTHSQLVNRRKEHNLFFFLVRMARIAVSTSPFVLIWAKSTVCWWKQLYHFYLWYHSSTGNIKGTACFALYSAGCILYFINSSETLWFVVVLTFLILTILPQLSHKIFVSNKLWRLNFFYKCAVLWTRSHS